MAKAKENTTEAEGWKLHFHCPVTRSMASRNKILIAVLRKLWNILHFLLCVVPLNIIMEKLTRRPNMDMSKFRKRPNDTAIVTGANRGVGAEIVKKLLQLEMHVIVGVRNIEQMEAVLQEIREQGITTGSLEIIHLDLNYLSSVRAFANEIILKGIPIHLLINNAGAMSNTSSGKEPLITSDGNEELLQSNALAPFLLNNLLLTQLIGGGTRECYSSIVDVSSVSQYYGRIDFEDLNSRKWFDNNQVYSNSKLIQTALNSYLGIKLRDYGIRVRANSLHPGITGTNYLYTMSWHFGLIGAIFRAVTGKPESGANEVLYVAIDPEVAHVTGKYFIRHKVDPDVPALSTRVMERLWDTACERVGIDSVFKKMGRRELKFLDLDLGEELDRASAIGPKKPSRRIKPQPHIQTIPGLPGANPDITKVSNHRAQIPDTFRWESKRVQQLFKSAVGPTQCQNENSLNNATAIDVEITEVAG